MLKLAKAVNTIFPNTISDGYAMKLWYSLLKGESYSTASAALQTYMTSADGHFPPKPADIIGYARKIAAEPSECPEGMTAWHMVEKAIRNGYYGAENEFYKLPKVVQKAVGDPGNIRMWAMMPEKMLQTTEAHFLQSYNTVLKRKEEYDRMPDAVKKLIKVAENGRNGETDNYLADGPGQDKEIQGDGVPPEAVAGSERVLLGADNETCECPADFQDRAAQQIAQRLRASGMD